MKRVAMDDQLLDQVKAYVVDPEDLSDDFSPSSPAAYAIFDQIPIAAELTQL